MFVLDASPIIYLAKVKLLEKLKELDKFYLTNSVFKEVVERASDAAETKYIKMWTEKSIKNPKSDLFTSVYGLSKADSESLSLAKELSCTIILDEKRGREIAKLSSIDVHGTVYLLIQMVKKKILTKSQFKQYLDKIITEGFYLSTTLYSEVLNV